MANVSTHNVPDKQHGDEDAYGWKQEIEQVGVLGHESGGEEMLYFLNERLKHVGCQACAHTDHEAQHEHHLTFGVLAFYPVGDNLEELYLLASKFEEIHSRVMS